MLALAQKDIKFVKGIGPQRAELLRKELGINTAADLLRHYPTGYRDRSHTSTLISVRDLRGSTDIPAMQFRGHFIVFNVLGEGVRTRLVGLFTDGTATIECVWFRSIRAVRLRLTVNTEYYIYGKPTFFNHTLQMTHPEVDKPDSIALSRPIQGVYPLTERLRQRNLSSRILHAAITQLLSSTPMIHDFLPASVVKSENLMSLDTAIRTIHAPKDEESLSRARFRFKFEELFIVEADILRRALRIKWATQGYIMPHIGSYFNNFYTNALPFNLTGAQKRVIKEIHSDITSGRQMNRLLQGDVGSGKTVVAVMAMLLALDNGCQACLMAPTEILANQHYDSVCKMLSPIGVNIRLLTGNTKTKERRLIDKELADGTLHILIGTHALLEGHVQFKRLGMAIIDEQHRFGVAQRSRLWLKGDVPPHILVMTATPIPRTLAMTVYGDLQVSVIDELPPGRKPIKTVLLYEEQRALVIANIKKQISQGHQVYIVHPLIDENDKLELRSLAEGYEKICRALPDVEIVFVHGRLKPDAKDEMMQRFVSGKAAVLVATTVIEVGVNVPNATTMIIENAERFGLSQLHQLRGRVGRGADSSYCILMTKREISATTRKRLEVMTSTNNGFVIAEADMQMRGPGDIEGTMQSGLPFSLKMANLSTDGLIIAQARAAAERVLDEDPDLSSVEDSMLNKALALSAGRTADWSMIS